MSSDNQRREIPQPLTIERLRQYKGLENVTDEEAEKIISQLNDLAVLFCEFNNQENSENYGKNE